nr:uncharacterized protein LOC117605174 [Osmia lignaria]
MFKMNAIKEELLKWTCKTHATNSYLDKRMLREKALEFARTHGLDDFKCSEKWLNTFLRGHGFSVDLQDRRGPTFANYRDWIDLMRSTIIKYKHNDLFHVDELTMYTDVLPLRIVSEETLSETRRNRVTILMGCNSSGTTKLPLLICGTYPSKIRVKEHVYCNNEDSYIEDELFRKWLTNVNERMFNCNRKILMFLRRNRAHALKDFAPSNLKLIYLPEDFPPLLRPLRKHVFHYIKMIFRRRYVERLKQCNEEWNLRDVLQSLIEAWETIPREIIIFSFQKTHFRTDDCILQIECDSWDSLKVGISFKRFVTFDDELSNVQPNGGKHSRNPGYNLRAINKNVIRIKGNKLNLVNERELSPQFDRGYQMPSELRNHIEKKLNRILKDKHRSATSFLNKNAEIERKSRKRAHGETRFSEKGACEESPFVPGDSNVTSSRSIYGKTFEQDEEQPQRQQTETDGIRESLQAVLKKALTLTSLVNAEYAKKLIDSIHASIHEISLQTDNMGRLKSFENQGKMDYTSEQPRTTCTKMKENTDEISTNLQFSEKGNQPSTSSNDVISLSEIAQSAREETESIQQQCSLNLHIENSGEKSQAKLNPNDEESIVRQEVFNLNKKREKSVEDDSSVDEPSEKKSKMDHNWSKQFETNFVFGSQNTNCSMGIRHDDNTVESGIFNAKPSFSPRD